MIDTDFEALLGIPDIKVVKTEINSDGCFLIYAESTQEGTLCHSCGNKIDKIHGKDRVRRIRHLPIFGRVCFIIITFTRYICRNCEKTTTENVPWCTRNSSYTVDFEKYVLLSLVNSTIEAESIKLNIGYGAIEGMMDRHIRGEVDWSRIKELNVIGIDEISLKKGHKDFVTIVTARTADVIHILGVLKGKEKKTVKEFFLSIPKN